jgi:hypothetical protein
MWVNRVMRRIGAPEMRFIRTVIDYDRYDKLINEDILRELNIIKSVNEDILKCKSNWLSHVVRIPEA